MSGTMVNTNISYSYGDVSDEKFWQNWHSSRPYWFGLNNFLDEEIYVKSLMASCPLGFPEMILNAFFSSNFCREPENRELIRLIKNIEVWRRYDENMCQKFHLSGDLETGDIDAYTLCSLYLLKTYQATKNLACLNASLKINDLLIARHNNPQNDKLAYVISYEKFVVEELRKSLEGS